MSCYIKVSLRFKNVLQTKLMPAIRIHTLSALSLSLSIYIYMCVCVFVTPISPLLTRAVFKDAVSSLDVIAMNNIMITYNEFQRMWKESSWPKLKYGDPILKLFVS